MESGRLSVEELCSDVPNDRIRFEVELKPGETTVVSWVKLLKDSGIPVDHSPPPSPNHPMEYRLVPRNVPDKRITRSQVNLESEVTKLESSSKNVK